MPSQNDYASFFAFDDFDTCFDDAPVSLQRIVRKRLVRPLMAARLGERKLRMDAAESDDDSPEDVARDEETRAVLKQMGELNRLLLSR